MQLKDEEEIPYEGVGQCYQPSRCRDNKKGILHTTLLALFYPLGKKNNSSNILTITYLTLYEIGDLVSPIAVKTTPKGNKVERNWRRHPNTGL